MPITRRDFCKTLAISGVSSLLAACSATQLGNHAPAGGVQRPLVVWTLQNCLDAPLARWRRLHPQTAVNRIALTPTEIASRVAAAIAGHEAMPNALVADSTTLGHSDDRVSFVHCLSLHNSIPTWRPSGIPAM
jgi:hypothetical protein